MKVRIVAALVAVLMTCLTLWLADWVMSKLPRACSHADQRICAIDKQLRRVADGHEVVYRVHREPGSRVFAHTQWVVGGKDIVHLQATEAWSYEELFYVMAHEFGHSYKRHSRRLLESIAPIYWRSWSDYDLYAQLRDAVETDERPTPVALNHAVELEADAFAVRTMNTFHVPVRAAMHSILGDDKGGSRHPSAEVRYVQAEVLLERLEAAH